MSSYKWDFRKWWNTTRKTSWLHYYNTNLPNQLSITYYLICFNLWHAECCKLVFEVQVLVKSHNPIQVIARFKSPNNYMYTFCTHSLKLMKLQASQPSMFSNAGEGPTGLAWQTGGLPKPLLLQKLKWIPRTTEWQCFNFKAGPSYVDSPLSTQDSDPQPNSLHRPISSTILHYLISVLMY